MQRLPKPSDNQKEVLAELPDEFVASGLTKKQYNCIATSFRRRGWMEQSICSDPRLGTGASGGRARCEYMLTKEGKRMRAEFRRELGYDD